MKTPEAPVTPARAEAFWLGILAVAAGSWFFWSAGQPATAYFEREASGYYGLQTEGFRQGQLNVAIEPSPGLLALKDPYDPVANAPYRVHDMTLWRGKYYLYYGVAPVLTFFLPITALTGWYPSEPCAVAAFCSLGVWISLALLGAVRRRHFPGAPTWALAAGSVVLVLANPVARLTLQPQFYQVPIACAFALHMGMLAAIYRSLHSVGGKVWIWLATASAFYGLSIAARPNYLLSGFALVVPFGVLIWRARTSGLWRAGIRLGLAAFGPALIAGLGLLFYNWVRFGDPAEFGMIYALSGEKGSALKLVSLEYVAPRLHDYLLGEGYWMRYFPFFRALPEIPYGILRYGPWLLVVPAALLFRGRGERKGRAALVWTIVIAMGANLALLSIFLGRWDRYLNDFAPAALLLAGVGGLALGERYGLVRGTRCLAGFMAGSTVLIALAVWVARVPEQPWYLPLARLANQPIHWWEQWMGDTPGGIRLELELPEGRDGLSEPLVHTGISADRSNWMQIDYLPGEQARLGFFHAGLGLLSGQVFSIPADRKITVDLECGALLPPAAHPMYSQWSEFEQTTISRKLRARVNGKEVLTGVLGCYESTPGDVQIGRMRWIRGGMQPAFSGRVLARSKLPVLRSESEIGAISVAAPVEIKLRFPADQIGERQPLMLTGDGTKFDILFCRYVGQGLVRFGIYHHGFEPTESEAVAFDPLRSHTLQVWMGSLADLNEHDEATDLIIPAALRLVVILDGKVVLNREQTFYPAAPSSIVFGKNTLVAGLVSSVFGGRIEAVKAQDFNVLPEPMLEGQFGAVDMTVQFPRAAFGAAEPLVVTGIGGAGDFVFVRYLAENKVSFGFDHWGVGGLEGKPVQVDLSLPHRLRISIGSLYPRGSDVGEWRARVQVKLDDAVVLEGTYSCHPTSRTQIKIGENQIGGSTCGPRFSGRILRIDRPAKP